MQSSCLVKYTTRSLYIRTLVVHTYRRRSSSTDPRTIPGPCPGTQRFCLQTICAAWLPQKTAAAKLNSPQRGAANSPFFALTNRYGDIIVRHPRGTVRTVGCDRSMAARDFIKTSLYTHIIHTHTHTYTHTYIYIYIIIYKCQSNDERMTIRIIIKDKIIEKSWISNQCQPRRYTFQRYFGVNKVDPVSRVARILHGSLVNDFRMFLTYVTSLGDGQGAVTLIRGVPTPPGPPPPPPAPPSPPSTGPYRPNGPEGPSAPTFTALLSQRPLNRTSHTFPPDANNASDLSVLWISFRLRGRSSRFVDRAGDEIDLEDERERRRVFVTFVSCAPGVIPGVCPSDFWIGARADVRETPGTERHHEGYFTRIGDKAHIAFASPAHFFFLIRTNGGLMGPLYRTTVIRRN
ncbi:hypothetical protein ALC62_02141 [Cyphomyrmex costatus]|uniref:Uncharacterized protein n=1 Tax=Cyphomyrmex costatus TaxID=456900 RepID=A0A195D235_9HYME|nr:hypothetical protein ALC62_02141 [Cyphomyrmex costatus]